MPTFAVTLGDPLGIGPEIVKKALEDRSIRRLANWSIFGEEMHGKKPGPKEAGLESFSALKLATSSIKNGLACGLVTAPVSKAHLNMAGFGFPGQTEFLASVFSAKKTAMMLASPKLKVVLVTIHVALRDIFKKLTAQAVYEKIVLAHKALVNDFRIKKPLLAVCGLNPHAGEGGLFGTEEGRIISPAIRKAQHDKINVSGPYPPDSIFHEAIRGKYDAVICHYHDQGLIPLKTLSFYKGVNVTLGLPIIRTSPDHGCAFDIAGKGIANPSSIKSAMRLAVEIWKNRQIIFNK